MARNRATVQHADGMTADEANLAAAEISVERQQALPDNHPGKADLVAQAQQNLAALRAEQAHRTQQEG